MVLRVCINREVQKDHHRVVLLRDSLKALLERDVVNSRFQQVAEALSVELKARVQRVAQVLRE